MVPTWLAVEGWKLIDEEEEQAVLEVLRAKRLFRTHGPYEGPSKVAELEEAFAVHLDVNPLLSNEEVEETIEGLNRVLDALE